MVRSFTGDCTGARNLPNDVHPFSEWREEMEKVYFDSWKTQNHIFRISSRLCSVRLSHWRIKKWEKLHKNKNGRKTCSWKEERPPMPHLKLIWYFWHEGRDLFHEPVYTALTPCLQQGGDGEGSNTAVGVRDEVFQVQVASSDCRWMLHGHL